MQYTVYRTSGRNTDFPLLIDITSDIIGDINRRMVIPLMPLERFGAVRPVGRLNPILMLVDDIEYVLMTHEAATIPAKALGAAFCDAAAYRSTVKAAVDFMLDGI